MVGKFSLKVGISKFDHFESLCVCMCFFACNSGLKCSCERACIGFGLSCVGVSVVGAGL